MAIIIISIVISSRSRSQPRFAVGRGNVGRANVLGVPFSLLAAIATNDTLILTYDALSNIFKMSPSRGRSDTYFGSYERVKKSYGSGV